MHPIPGRAPGPHLHLAQVQVWWWDCRPWGRRARFQAVCVAQAGSAKMALSRLAHQRVTQAVGQPLRKWQRL
jgi:hypothetical protein